MQGIESLPQETLNQLQDYQLRIQPDDQLAISINSRDQELIAPFNSYMMIGTGGGQSMTQSYGATSATTSGIAYFPVNKQGVIHFPILGDLPVQGLTHDEVSAMIENRLREGNYVKDPSVKVKIMSFKVTVLGEVKTPGVQSLTNERLTILEALGKAGDLLPSGQRENILVMREENGQRSNYRIDLTDARAVLESPAFYLQQNDVVYVQPNKVRQGQSTINDNSFRSVATWLSVASVATSITILITNAVKK